MVMACCWLKLILMLAALESGYQWVVFVDSDAEIMPTCPDVRTVFQLGKTLYMANGESGRLNSGFIVAMNDPETLDYLRMVLGNYDKILPEEDRVSWWGENGHIIHFAKNRDCIGQLYSNWNNTGVPDSSDFVRHYTGRMRREKKVVVGARWILRIVHCMQSVIRICRSRELEKVLFIKTIMNLYCEVVKGYEAFFMDGNTWDPCCWH
jgi:hypothetical protein